MILAALTVALCMALQVAHAQLQCGNQADTYPPNLSAKTRIIGGKEANPHSWPWLLSLKFNGRPICGSSLLQVGDNTEQSDIVLTAGHCVVTYESLKTPNPILNSPLSSFTVLAGAHRNKEEEDGTVTRTAVNIEYKPGYTFTSNDVAIIKLDSPIPFTDTVRPICLPPQDDSIPVGLTCVAAGWGRNESTDLHKVPDALQQLIMPVHPAETCKNSWGSYEEVMMICAGTLAGTSAVCNGDSGGQLACRKPDGSWTLYGVASFVAGDTCATTGYPPVFARVSNYVDWINERTLALSALAEGPNPSPSDEE